MRAVVPLALALAMTLVVLSGCVGGRQDAAGSPASPEDAAETGRVARGADRSAEGPAPTEPQAETLYLLSGIYGDELSAEPYDGEMDGSGFAVGGDPCEAATPGLPPICWGSHFDGIAFAPHLAGAKVQLWIWLQGEPTTLEDIVVEAWLTSNGELVGQGTTGPIHPLPGAPFLGPDGCSLGEAEFVLTADVAAEAELDLAVRADGLWGGDCYAGGVEGNRITIAAR
jgi:hypothetical protein